MQQNKLEELTGRIYNEGISKAKEEADKILTEAKAKAEKIVKDAENKAIEIKNKADKEAKELEKKVIAEIKQASTQSIRALKQQITELVSSTALAGDLKSGFDDKNFVKKIIETAISNWNPKGSEAVSLNLLLSENDKKELGDYFKANTKKLLDGELNVSFDYEMKGGFKIGPKDASYLISFEEDDFLSLFKAYLKQKTVELLFEGK